MTGMIGASTDMNEWKSWGRDLMRDYYSLGASNLNTQPESQDTQHLCSKSQSHTDYLI